jgi:hypothetical protein
MSGVFSEVANFGGKQPPYNSYTKQFYSSIGPVAQWIYKSIENIVYITPQDDTKEVYIDNDLIVTGSIINPSDEEIKTNIKEISKSDIDKLKYIVPKSFTYSYDEREKPHFGFIAQQVEEYYPDLVTPIGPNGIKGVAYTEFIPLLLQKIITMETEIQELKNEVESLREREKN